MIYKSSVKLSLTFLLLLGLAMAYGKSSPLMMAEDLVRTTQIDRLALRGLLFPFRADMTLNQNIDGDEWNRFNSCLDLADSSIVTTAFALELEKRMSSEDVGLALQFYQRPVGKKLLRRDAVQNEQTLAPRPDTEIVSFSEDELKELEQFEKTNASSTIQRVPLEVWNTRAVWSAVVSEGQRILNTCANAAPKSK